MKKFFVFILFLVCCSFAFADNIVAGEYDVGDYSIFIDANGEIEILQYYGNDIDLVIPDEIEGFPVTKLGYRSFAWNNTFESVVIPDTVKKT